MGLASCGTNSARTTKQIDVADKAIDAIDKPDSYYLVKCKKPPMSVSDDLEYIIRLVKRSLMSGADCYNRHNPLTDQVK